MRARFILVLALLLAGCNGSDNARGPSGSSGSHRDTSSASPAAASGARGAETSRPGSGRAVSGTAGNDAAHRFGEKSGIITMKSRLGPSINATLSFDDYGALMCTRTDVSDSIGGKHLTITNVSTLKNGVAVLYDPLKKIGRRSMQPDVAVNYFPDFSTMSDSAKLALKYKKLGTMTVAGRICQGHSIERHGIVVTAWLWEGIPLRTESMYAPGEGLVLEATNVNLNVPVPPETFDVPAGITVEDVPAYR